mgnify:CR=1 FL=1
MERGLRPVEIAHGEWPNDVLRHTYASLCAAAGLPVEKVSQYLGHSKTSTTLDIYVHLFRTDDASDDMAALDSMDTPDAPNVVPMRRRR